MVKGKARHFVKSLIQRKGFTFAQVEEAFDGQDAMAKVVEGIFGDKWVTPDKYHEAAEQFEDALTVIFYHLNDRADAYCILRGHHVFYETLASELPTECDFDADLLKKLEEAYVEARRAYQGRASHDTRLVQAVDDWIKIKDTVTSFPSLQTFSLSARPTGLQSIISGLQEVNFTSSNAVWPPQYFSAGELTIISMNYLRPLLHGRTPANPGSLPLIPNKKTHPRDIRGFLCAIALMHYKADSMWNLSLRPVAQLAVSNDAHLWSKASGGESRLCITLQRCMTDAVDVLKSGKLLSTSLATPWFSRPWGAVPSINDMQAAAGQSQADLWSALCPRQGFAVVLHKYGDGVELVVFDPIHRHPIIKNDPIVKSNRMAIFGFRRAIQEHAKKAVEDAGEQLVRGWYGGRMEAVDGRDSVQLTSDWIRQLVVASATSDPLAVNDSVFVQWGFEAITM
ncbi:hypothetical protein CSOJ01_02834 [Colletotrichum sojae]|uniref:Uncharacterized protein n=1 Tax=Colletotrichum sojae TaxID=2175907 RepID=A0A8H6JNY6_9PEZI|nr:hypothetical protein CSOJ01_02834 [Colletotrichum sojae]